MRLFVALRPPIAALEHLQIAVDAVAPTGVGGGSSPLRWTDPMQRHITLAFYGEVPDGVVPEVSAALAAVAADWSPFDVQLTGAGAFSGTTLWTGVRRVRESDVDAGDLSGTGTGSADDRDRSGDEAGDGARRAEDRSIGLDDDAARNRSENSDDDAVDGRDDAGGDSRTAAGGLVALMAQCEEAGAGVSRLEPRDRRRAHLTLARLSRRVAGGRREGRRREGRRRGGMGSGDRSRGGGPWSANGDAAGGAWSEATERGGGSRRGAYGERGNGREGWAGVYGARGGGRRQAGPARTGRTRAERDRADEFDLGVVVRALSVYRGPVWQASEIELVASTLGEGRGGGPHHEVLATFPFVG